MGAQSVPTVSEECQMASQEYRAYVSIAPESVHIRVAYRNTGEGRFSVLYQGRWSQIQPEFDPSVMAHSIQEAIRRELQAILSL